ncbi:MAG: formyltransferase family protein [Candidatus Marinimicrobia bacterium]|nr:formyltransferase family protein [Candidatus Neomarinimicrobiota bacterium]MDA1363885.1 formyltransferase family protein [Candidatus Neomarinimicrobiota bacterium]
MRIVLCANHRAGHEALLLLLSESFVDKDSVLVFTHANSDSKKIIQECSKLNIKCIDKNINNFENEVFKFSPHIILSCYYRYIIKEHILSLAKLGCLNIHPSLLPHYKGTFSSPWAIINNEKLSGISIHEMVKEVDNGNIIMQETTEIFPSDTAYSLYHRLVSLAIKMLPNALKLYISGYRGVKQKLEIDKSKHYFSRDLPFGGLLKTKDTTYEEASRFIRAMYFPPFDGAKFKLNSGVVKEANSIEDIESFIHEFK